MLKSFNPKFGHFNYYSLAKLCYGLFGKIIQGGSHSPTEDAAMSMRVYMHAIHGKSEFAMQQTRGSLFQMTIKRQFPMQLMAANKQILVAGVCSYAFDPVR